VKISHKVPLATSVVILLAFSVFAWLQYHMVRDTLYERTERNINSATAAIAHQVSHWLNGKLALVDMMAQSIDHDFSNKTIQDVMDRPVLADEFILVFGGLHKDGQPIANDRNWNPPEGWDARVRPWYALAKSHDRAILTEPYADSATNDILISAVAKLTDNGTFKGAFGGDLSLRTVSEAINALNFDGTGYAFLINANGSIISHPDQALNGQPLASLFRKRTPDLTPELQELNLNGRTVMTSYYPLRDLYGSRWLIGVVLDKDKVMAEAYELSLNSILGALVSALIASAALYTLMQRLVISPVAHLTEVADEISRGKFSGEIQETEREDEIGALAKAIKRLNASLQITMKRLRKE